MLWLLCKFKTINYYLQVSISEHHDEADGLWQLLFDGASVDQFFSGQLTRRQTPVIYYRTLSLLCGHRIQWTKHSVTHNSLLFFVNLVHHLRTPRCYQRVPDKRALNKFYNTLRLQISCGSVAVVFGGEIISHFAQTR